jgi:ferrochelatase
VPVEVAMRYQNPSFESAVKKFAAKGAADLLRLTIFPHYAMSSYQSAVVRVQEIVAKLAPTFARTV